MAIPGNRDARLFYRCAFQRYEEARILLEAGYTTGALYLAGYGVECILKSLIVMSLPAPRRAEARAWFRGQRGHDLEGLRTLYLTQGGARFPQDINKHFIQVDVWSTDLRYTAGTVKVDEAEAFLASSVAIIRWADGRLC